MDGHGKRVQLNHVVAALIHSYAAVRIANRAPGSSTHQLGLQRDVPVACVDMVPSERGGKRGGLVPEMHRWHRLGESHLPTNVQSCTRAHVRTPENTHLAAMAWLAAAAAATAAGSASAAARAAASTASTS